MSLLALCEVMVAICVCDVYGRMAFTITPVSSHNSETTEYLANELNQYTSISTFVSSAPLRLDSPTYAPDGQQKSAKGKATRSPTAILMLARGLTNARARNGIPRRSGNCHMLFDGARFYTWDAENRLTSVSNAATGVFSAYAYDFMHRRIRKDVRDPATPSKQKSSAYVYDGWNVVMETLATALPSTNYYFWGLDLSGTLQSAGGVGGLLAVTRVTVGAGGPKTYFPLCDANGNVTEYIDSLGNVVAHYEYDAFGDVTSQSGDFADTFLFKFSTKCRDPETGLYYYGRRYYLPPFGCWLSRDPIEEDGGLNLYAIVGNDPVNKWDYLRKMNILWGECCDGKAYHSGKSCCINGTVVSRDEQVSIKICRRVANIPLGKFFSLLGFFHTGEAQNDGSE